MGDLFKKFGVAEANPLDEDICCRCIVRLRTSCWKGERGIHIKKDITHLRKMSGRGMNMFEEDISNIGLEEVVNRITNLYECEDGIYEILICNQSTDWETGYVDDYDYYLSPIKNKTQPILIPSK